jgi:hypothetical protein
MDKIDKTRALVDELSTAIAECMEIMDDLDKAINHCFIVLSRVP